MKSLSRHARQSAIHHLGPSTGFLIRDGADGLLVPIDNARAMAAALQRLIAEPWLARQLAENGRRRFEAEFIEAKAVGRYLDLFEAMLQDKAQRSAMGGAKEPV